MVTQAADEITRLKALIDELVDGLERLRENSGQFSYEEGGQAIDALIALGRSGRTG